MENNNNIRSLDSYRSQSNPGQSLAASGPDVAIGDGGPHDSDMNERIGRIEGNLEAQRIVKPMVLAVVSILFTVLLAVTLGGFAFLGVQVTALNTKVDAIPQRLSEEFRAMRADMSAQTSAIATAVTAAKQVPPQVILVPAPEPRPPEKKD
jgi:hypothetical protein